MTPIPLLRLPLLLLLAGIAVLAAGDAPTDAEWRPVEQAIAADPLAAKPSVDALSARYPAWPDGRRALAAAHVQRRQWREAYNAANAVLSAALTAAPRDPTRLDPMCGEIAVLAAGRLGRDDVAIKAADLFTSENDRTGRVAFRAAEVLLAKQRLPEAASRIGQAVARSSNKPPAEFLALQGSIAVAMGDAATAEAVLVRSLGLNKQQPEAWYALGLAQLTRAMAAAGDERRSALGSARSSFEEAVKQRPTDADALAGLGKALLELGKLERGSGGGGSVANANAINFLERAVRERPALVSAKLFLGEAYLHAGNRDGEAARMLQSAHDAGARSPEVTLLLITALSRSGSAAAASTLAAGLTVDSTAERIAIGMQQYRAGSHLNAATLLTAAAGDSSLDQAQRASLWRFAGHAHRRIAEMLGDQAERERHRDAARDAYIESGRLGDDEAARWLLAVERPRGALALSTAASHAIDWDWLDTSAWLARIGSYPSAATGGAGLAGWWRTHPLHVCIWIGLLLLCLGLGAWGLLRRAPATATAGEGGDSTPRQRPARPATGRTPRATPTPRPAPAGGSERIRSPLPISAAKPAVKASGLNRQPRSGTVPRPGDATQPISPPDQG